MDSKQFQDLLDEYNRNQMQTPSKPRKQLLTKEQEKSFNDRLDRLVKQFQSAINKKDLPGARQIMTDLQRVLRSLNKTVKLVEVKNKLFELAMEMGDLDLAIDGFGSNRALMNSNTKIYLETTALLAVSHLRKNEIEKAKPYIKEVLHGKDVIKTESTKEKFIEEVINRFDEEIALAALRMNSTLLVDAKQVEKDVELALTLTDEQIYAMLGKIAPKQLKGMLFEVDSFAKKQLTFKEAKLLPSSEDLIQDENAGKTIFRSLKRVIYNSLCSKESEVYKMVFTHGLSQINGKRAIIAAIASSIIGLGVAGATVITFAAALVIRFGLDVYCEHYKPSEITALRRKSK
jgi:hypothetical protein